MRRRAAKCLLFLARYRRACQLKRVLTPPCALAPHEFRSKRISANWVLLGATVDPRFHPILEP